MTLLEAALQQRTVLTGLKWSHVNWYVGVNIYPQHGLLVCKPSNVYSLACYGEFANPDAKERGVPGFRGKRPRPSRHTAKAGRGQDRRA